MTSGRNRLKAKQNRSFAQRAQQRASLRAVDSVLLPPALSRPSDLAEGHPRRRKRSSMGKSKRCACIYLHMVQSRSVDSRSSLVLFIISSGGAFSDPSNPLARRAVVASLDPSQRELEDEAFIHQHRQPNQTTGTEQYRRMRNSERPRDGSLHIHRNGTKQSLHEHPGSNLSHQLLLANGRPPGGQYSYRREAMAQPLPVPPLANGRFAPAHAPAMPMPYPQGMQRASARLPTHGPGQIHVDMDLQPVRQSDAFFPQETMYQGDSGTYNEGGNMSLDYENPEQWDSGFYQSGEPKRYSPQYDCELVPSHAQYGRDSANFQPDNYAPDAFQGEWSAMDHPVQYHHPNGIAEPFAASGGFAPTPRVRNEPFKKPLFTEELSQYYEDFEAPPRGPSVDPREQRDMNTYRYLQDNQRKQSPHHIQGNDAGQFDPFFERGELLMSMQESMSSRRHSAGANLGGVRRFCNNFVGMGNDEVQQPQQPGIARFQKGASVGSQPGGIVLFQAGQQGRMQLTQGSAQHIRVESDKKRPRQDDWFDAPRSQVLANNSLQLNGAHQVSALLQNPLHDLKTMARPFRQPDDTSPVVNPYRSNMPIAKDPHTKREPDELSQVKALNIEQHVESENEYPDFPMARQPAYDAPSFLRFFNESVEVTLKGEKLARPQSPLESAKAAALQQVTATTQDSDTLDDLDLEGKTSLWESFAHVQK